MISEKDVCILVPYFNAGISLLVSLQSVEIGSLMPDVCIVDDGSQVLAARAVLDQYNGELPIKLIELPKNEGIEYALNSGLKYCVPRYRYIARLDCGDKNIGDRIKNQRDFLENNPLFAMVGGWANYVDLKGELQFVLKHPVDQLSIRRRIFLNSPFTHPAIMMRASVLREIGFYPVGYPAAEDLALFFKIVMRYPTANLPYSVIDYEINPGSISSVRRKIQIKSRVRLIFKYFDGSWIAMLGLIRGVLTYYMPRKLTVFINRLLGYF